MKKYLLILPSLALLLFLIACEPVRHTRGNIPLPSAIQSLEVGKTNRQDILQSFGTPSATGNFRDNVWYYMGWQTEQTAFFDPKIVDHKVHIIIFDDKGILKQHKLLTKADLQNIILNPDQTPTTGIDISVLEQLIGNLGRFRNEAQ